MGLKQDLIACRGPVAGFAAMGLYWGGFAGLVPALKARSALSDEAFGAAMLVSTCGAVAAMLAAPAIERRLGRAALPLLSVLLAAAFLLPGLAQGAVGFALAMAAAAALVGLLDVVMNAQVAAIEAARKRPLMNLAHGVYSFVYAGSATLAGLARQAGATPLAVFAALGLVTVGLALVMARAGGPAPPEPARRQGRRLGGALILAGGSIALIGFLAEQGAEGWSALHLERSHGASPAAAAIGPALLGLSMGVGRLFGQGLALRLRGTTLIGLGALMSAAGAVLAGIAPTLGLAYAGFATLGLGASVLVPTAFAEVAARTPPSQRSAAIARLSVIGYAGFFIGPPIMGGLSGAFGLATAFCAVGAILALVPLLITPWLRRSAAPLSSSG